MKQVQWSDVYISASAASLAQPESVADAVRQGRCDAQEAELQDYARISVAAEGQTPADMAVAAGRHAMERSGRSDGVELLMHASVGFQGIDHWSPAAYIQNRTIGGRAAAFEVKQASNGALVALNLAAAHVTSGAPSSAVLITTGDAYPLPVFDRYRSDQGTVRADGGAAMLVTRSQGVARLLSTALVGDATHEEIHRAGEQWRTTPGEAGWPVDLRARKEGYLRTDAQPGHAVSQTLIGGNKEALQTALADANTSLDDIEVLVLPNLGRQATDRMFRLTEQGIDFSRTCWDWGRNVGHIGAGDQLAALTHLFETRRVRIGDRIALCGLGSGFTFGCAVLEITAEPDWSPTACLP
ncbi:ketoacyl-ACP synthase III family protein [Streptomyces xanthochromogenes]|uniref:ketoacyl-ACP synthase III family protein n=1 Tax=Streptomyces xanthochromogenes TaxID=67384 RepID=UPI00341BD4B0